MIPLCEPKIEGNEWKYIKDCLDSGWVSSVGNYVNLFEKKFKSYINSESSIVTMNGTSAITLALRCLGIGPGDEVIVPSMTFVASVNPIIYVGATPVFIDITSDTWVMDASKIEISITENTKAIIPVHLYGNMVDMQNLVKIAKKHNIYVIEDATEALGSEYKTEDGFWHKAGTMGDFGVFSFNGNKIITTGAGGMLVTNNISLGERAKYLSTQAKTSLKTGGFYHSDIGYNYRMPNLLAAMGVAQLENISKYLESKTKTCNLYNSLLKDILDVTLPSIKDNIKNSNWLYSILFKDEIQRDNVIDHLKSREILTRPFFSPLHFMNPYKNYKKFDMTNTINISRRGINLPSSVGITDDEIIYVFKTIKEMGF